MTSQTSQPLRRMEDLHDTPYPTWQEAIDTLEVTAQGLGFETQIGCFYPDKIAPKRLRVQCTKARRPTPKQVDDPSASPIKRRNTFSKRTNCPWKITVVLMGNQWVITPNSNTVTLTHNHELGRVGERVKPRILQTAWPSPLAGLQNETPLTDERNEDGKSYVNPPREGVSETYQQFPPPFDNGTRGGFDVHVYYFQNNKDQSMYAHELWERIRREFPELRIYRLWDGPIGPHPIASFEVNLFNPSQFGAFVPWLTIWRGPLSVLIHPNSMPMQGETDAQRLLRDHTQRATWMGDRIPLDWAPLMK